MNLMQSIKNRNLLAAEKCILVTQKSVSKLAFVQEERNQVHDHF